MNRAVKIAIAVVIVYILLSRTELYVPRSFVDEEWRAVQNDTRRKAGPFNTCSPESFDECAKVDFPILSRY